MVNAADAMPAGGPVRLHSSLRTLAAPVPAVDGPVPAGEWAVLEVRDWGVGMSEEVQRRAFEPFLGPQRTGTGFGLASVAAIVREAGGHVQVLSEAGAGTTVSVYLPAQAQVALADAGSAGDP